MVEHSGCRCACQGGEEFELPPDDSPDSSGTGCCNAQVFTSVLLGILSCVLMTGGVFLAFHRWDPMWLLVSGIGVILIFIGTILHCCSNNGSSPGGSRRHNSKVCCGRPIPPENPHAHMVTHSGSLTEQLLPLSNARSVSQLSLNMLPGYFPPVVTAYGIEQHSAVVQNINRLVQQQQQQQSSQNSGSTSPGGATKSFILLSLPGDTPPANLQNLVATVYQLDGNVTSETPATDANLQMSSAEPAVVNMPKPTLVLKSVEVQTCQVWPNVPVPNLGDPSAVPSTSNASSSSESERVNITMASGTTQTDERTNSEVVIDLMDCSADVATNCDTLANPREGLGNFASIPLSSSVTLVDVSEPSASSASHDSSTVLVNIPENSTEDTPGLNLMAVENTSFVSVDGPDVLSEVLVDISENATICSPQNPPSEQSQNHDQVTQPSCELLLEENNTHIPSGSSRDNELVLAPPLTEIQAPDGTPHCLAISSLDSSSSGNLSAIDADIDDGEFLGRSSPPPSYDDVTHEGESSVGAFGLAYGTI